MEGEVPRRGGDPPATLAGVGVEYPYLTIRGDQLTHRAYATIARRASGRPSRIMTACGIEAYIPRYECALKPGWGRMLAASQAQGKRRCPRCWAAVDDPAR